MTTTVANFPNEAPNWFLLISSDVGANLDGWRSHIMDYLSNPIAKIDQSIRQLACNYIMVNGDLSLVDNGF
jgi:hypothetical protein